MQHILILNAFMLNAFMSASSHVFIVKSIKDAIRYQLEYFGSFLEFFLDIFLIFLELNQNFERF
jgi:hypothetical protein